MPTIKKPWRQKIESREICHQDSLGCGFSRAPKNKCTENITRSRNGLSLSDKEINIFHSPIRFSNYLLLFIASLAYFFPLNPSSVAVGFLVFQKTASAYLIPPSSPQMRMGFHPTIYPPSVGPLNANRPPPGSYHIINQIPPTQLPIFSTRILNQNSYGTVNPFQTTILGNQGPTNGRESFSQNYAQTPMENLLNSQRSPGMSNANFGPVNRYL
ncbi:hypothetical protein RF11_09715 [Thelohanellus kitauei]|uniref:Uncharacterized protein n=1 Tax=Thelohanellus kitauei TaxID=669202 RepID=A0A0C2MYP2_THEKT|nr:hypothetical protein RF11_09715 [Thelohanellus kitauei]